MTTLASGLFAADVGKLHLSMLRKPLARSNNHVLSSREA